MITTTRGADCPRIDRGQRACNIGGNLRMKRLKLLPFIALVALPPGGRLQAQDQIFSDVPFECPVFFGCEPVVSSKDHAWVQPVAAQLLPADDAQPSLSRAAQIIRSIYSALYGDPENFTVTQAGVGCSPSNLGACTSHFSSDVPVSDPNFFYIQKMWELGITGGYNSTTYGPYDPATNGHLAVFTARARSVVLSGSQNAGPANCTPYQCSQLEYYPNEQYTQAATDYAMYHDWIQADTLLIGGPTMTSQCYGGYGFYYGYFCTDTATTRSQAAFNIVNGIWNGLNLPANTRANFDIGQSAERRHIVVRGE
jgi:hypothetical protein